MHSGIPFRTELNRFPQYVTHSLDADRSRTSPPLNLTMKKLCRILVAIFLLLSVVKVHAVGTGSGWGTITQVNIPASGGMVRFSFSQPIVNPAVCEGTDFYVRELDNSVASSRYLSAILTAYTAQKEVSFWIEGCTQGQWWGKTRPQPDDIYMR